MRKRKRQVLEEEESMDEDDFKKAKDEFNQDLLPQEFDLPEDTTGDHGSHMSSHRCYHSTVSCCFYVWFLIFLMTGACTNQLSQATFSPWPDPTILVEAGGEEDQRKALKVLAFPILDDDALPSSVNQKVLASIAKWRVKMHQLGAVIDQLDDAPDSYKEPSDLNTIPLAKLFNSVLLIMYSYWVVSHTEAFKKIDWVGRGFEDPGGANHGHQHLRNRWWVQERVFSLHSWWPTALSNRFSCGSRKPSPCPFPSCCTPHRCNQFLRQQDDLVKHFKTSREECLVSMAAGAMVVLPNPIYIYNIYQWQLWIYRLKFIDDESLIQC